MPDTIRHILYIEDDTVVAEKVKNDLERDNYRVTLVHKGRDGQRELENNLFDLVLIDNILPDTNGIEIIRKLHKEGSSCPYILVTAKGNENIAVEAFRLGASDYVIKNSDYLTILPYVIEKALKDREAADNRAKAEDLVKKLINTAPDPLFVKDENHKWILLNDAFCEFVGYTREELIGKSDYDIFTKEEADIFWQNDDKVFKSGEVSEQVESITNARGITSIVSTKKTAFRNNFTGEKILVGQIRDMTSKINLEKKIARIRRENNAFMRHELRNLLAPVLAYSEMLIDKYGMTFDEKQMKYSTSILKSANKIAHLIDTLKELEDFEFGQKELKTKKLNLVHIVEQAVSAILFLAESMNVNIDLISTAEVTDCMIDEDLMPGVFINLIKNAVEHVGPLTDPGEKTVKIDIVNDYDKIVVRINNRGGTIPQEELQLFFEKFNSNREQKSGGSGLGTTYSYLITKAHGGTAAVKSNEEDGTTVTITLDTVE